MTVTVQAGITIGELRRLLATENQRLPVDVPLSDQATLGGALAANASGLRRYGFGTLRDYVIGIRAVNDQGHQIKAGGRVVKNVAGYDLCKLFVGSLGTLGIITQVTLKLRPRPERSTLVALACPGERLGPALDVLHASGTRPASICALNAAATSLADSLGGTRAGDWMVLVGFEDNHEAVAWQLGQLRRELTPLGIDSDREWTDAAAEPLWNALTDFPLVPAATLTFKANMLPHHIPDFCRESAKLPADLHLLAHAGSGIVIGRAGGDLTLDRARTILKKLLETAAAGRGNVILLRCPTAWKTELPVWGLPREDAWLMRVVKGRLDPGRLFNPGRFVDGI
jgi:glycolate oxidase FAD binding subunit